MIAEAKRPRMIAEVKRPRMIATLALATALALLALPAAAPIAGTGGVSAGTDAPKGKKAKLRRGKAIAPAKAPRRVVRVIRAANRIAKGKGYCWGGGHSSFRSKCYDCSGAVSYALHGGKLLDRPLDSGGLAKWGRRGKGKWITVYGHSGHAYAVIAGLRFDTSMTRGKGPGWSKKMRDSDGFKKRRKGRL